MRSRRRERLVLALGLVLVALSLRHVLVTVPPLLPVIRAELLIGVAQASILGMAPVLCFGIGALVGPPLTRRLGVEATTVLAMTLAAAGTVGRALVADTYPFIALTFLAVLGMGLGNIVGPPLVRRYFPDRVGPMMTLFALLTQTGVGVPALVTVPMAGLVGWRMAIGSWGLLAVLAIIPWAVQARRVRRGQVDTLSGSRTTGADPPIGTPGSAPDRGTASPEGPSPLRFTALARSSIAIGGAVYFGMAAFGAYGMIAWFPTLLVDVGLDVTTAGTVYGVRTFMAFPAALVTPLLAARMRNPFPVAVGVALASIIGYAGLLIEPVDHAMTWAVIGGLGSGAFPLAVTLFALRTATPAGAAALSGFALSVGYALGALGPVLAGALYSATGGWTWPLWMFLASSVVMVTVAGMLSRPRVLEDLTVPPRRRSSAPAR